MISALARETGRTGIQCCVAGLKDEFYDTDCKSDEFDFLGGSIFGPKALGYSPELGRLIEGKVSSNSIVHSHGLWMHPGLIARRVSIQNKCPLVISPHGMLEPWALNNSRGKKRLAAFLFENRNLRSAHCLHALCMPEAENFRRCGLRNPIAIIPNGIETKSFDSLPDPDEITQLFPELKGRRRILFLSRIHPKKGLPNLLKAWTQLRKDFGDWCLMIAGPSELGHEQELKALAMDLGIENSVFFLGPIYGEEKRKVLAGADIFVLPSFSEGFSMAILEAAAAGLPVLLTRECNFPELAAAGAGIEVSPDVEGIQLGLRQLLGVSVDQRRRMGQKGRDLVEQFYIWPKITQKMLAVYQWLLGRGPKPDCILSH